MIEVGSICDQQVFGFVINGAFGFVISARHVPMSMEYFDLDL